MSYRFADATLQRKNMPRITDRQFNYILNQYGFYVIVRKREPVVDNPVVCPCIADDDIFNQIDPDCPLCGGTGIIGGESVRDKSVKVVMQPQNSMGMMGIEVTYSYATKMERVQENCYVAGNVDVDLGDFIIDTYDAPGGERTMEYEVFDKEIWRLGLGGSRKRAIIFQKLQLRKTEYAKTVTELENY